MTVAKSSKTDPVRTISSTMPPALVATEGGCQSRAALDPATVARYAESYAAEEPMPPIVVYHDGARYWLADGFHRLAAAEKIEAMTILTEVRQGTRRDAILFSLGANHAHGLPRSNADKQRAVDVMVKDDEWSQWSNRRIAEACKVSEFLVRARRELSEHNGTNVNRSTAIKSQSDSIESTTNADEQKTYGEKPPVQTRTGLDGRSLNVDKIGSMRQPRKTDAEKLAGGLPEGINGTIEESRGEEILGTPAPEPERELTDEEYLATCPARAALSGETRRRFDVEALGHRALDKHRAAFARAFVPIHNRVRRELKGGSSAYFARIASALRLAGPTHWLACATCNGSGQSVLGKCGGCNGRGYHA